MVILPWTHLTFNSPLQFQICYYLHNPSAYESAGVSVSEFIEIEAIKNSIPITVS